LRPDIGQRIRQRRNEARLRQIDLGDVALLSERTISNAERGLISVAVAERIARALGLPLTAIWPPEAP
jgi:transcriptional regulator with XRE-family HTH domain